MARARVSGSGNSVTMIARITEAWAAAPTPCRKRAPIRTPSLDARPQSSEASVKTTSPAWKTRLRPARSPRRPASRSRLPKVMRKASTTQVRPDWLKWRSRWMAGSATFTIVTSRTIISWARQTTMSAAQRRRSMGGEGAGATVMQVPRDLWGGGSGAKLEASSGTIPEAPSTLSSGTSMSTVETPTPPSLARPKRADALRNYEKVLAAAREAFAEGGESTALEEIARRAGVGIGTLYRNFPNRQALVEALYINELEEVCRSAEELEGGDPWQALNDWLARFIAYIGTKQALAAELLNYLDHDAPLFQSCRASLYASGEPLLERAQEAGAVRPDVTIADVMQMVIGIAKLPSASAEQVDHILRIALDGLRYSAPK